MTAAANVFLDTNVLVYAHDRYEPIKGAQAQQVMVQLLGQGQPLLSMQVLAEFYWAVTRKIPQPLTHDEALAEIKRLGLMTRVVPINWDVLQNALRVIGAYGLPLWDAQILAAAALHGAAVVLSEDFQDGRTMEGVTFLNPFASSFNLGNILGP